MEGSSTLRARRRSLGSWRSAGSVAVGLGLLSAGCIGERGGNDPAPPMARHAVIIVVDTLRADVLQETRTPTWDALVAQGQVVDRAWSTSTWTVPAVISLFTGAFVRTHGWDLPTSDPETRPPLPADLPTLAEVLRAEGFATQGLYANGYLAEEMGFDRGFDEWARTSDQRMAEEVARRVAAWTGPEGTIPQRHLLYVHLLGPHSGLRPSLEARERWHLHDRWFTGRNGLLIGEAKRGVEKGARDAYRRAYRAVVEDTDERVGEILAALAPVRAETLVVLLADHGEELGEREVFGHGWSVAEALTHVPLVVAGPGVVPGRRPAATLAEVTDLVTDHLGVSRDWPVQAPWDGPLVSERHGKLAVLDGRWKCAWHGEARECFDLEADPGGLVPVAGPEAPAAASAALRAWYDRVPEGPPLARPVDLDPATIEAVRALGYLEP